MGLKIRRLKTGFAYYAEYKLGRHCIYEKIQAGSAREAKRIYAARDRELRQSTPPEARLKTRREQRDDKVNAALSAMLRKLIAKQVISEAEAIELLPGFASIPAPEAGTIVPSQSAGADQTGFATAKI
jgi:hypothetical protein